VPVRTVRMLDLFPSNEYSEYRVVSVGHAVVVTGSGVQQYSPRFVFCFIVGVNDAEPQRMYGIVKYHRKFICSFPILNSNYVDILPGKEYFK